MQYAKPVTLNVEECDRLSFLPYLFGNDFLYAEAYVYALAYSALFDHGLASKFDQRFASIRSTGNLTFSTAF